MADHLTFVFFAGLSGQVADVSYPITANLLILQIPGTSLQNNCAEPGDTLPSCHHCFCHLLHLLIAAHAPSSEGYT